MPADSTPTETPVDDASVGVANAEHAVQLIVALEHERRLTEARQINLMAEIESACVASEDGHASAKVMVRHNAKLSGAEAAARQKVCRLVKRCQQINVVFQSGGIGVDQIRLLGRVYANRRIQGEFVDQQGWFIAQAQELSFDDFEQVVAAWVELTDQDGLDPADRAHQDRNCTMVQNAMSKGWETKAAQAPNAGAIEKEIFDAYVEAEFHRDWEAAKEVHGDAVCNDLLARTDAQRRADAHHQIFLDAAANAEVSAAARVVHNVMWAQNSYDEMTSRFAGNSPNPLDPDSHRCSTVDGYRLDPADAFTDSLRSEIRRVVVDAKGVVIDMGRARFFTGLARLAAQFNHHECSWIGCHVPTSRCQIDHMQQHSKQGLTDQANAVPMCRRHNRHKEKGYAVWRDDTGKIHIKTPAGREIR